MGEAMGGEAWPSYTAAALGVIRPCNMFSQGRGCSQCLDPKAAHNEASSETLPYGVSPGPRHRASLSLAWGQLKC